MLSYNITNEALIKRRKTNQKNLCIIKYNILILPVFGKINENYNEL